MKKLLILSGKGGTGKTTTAATFIKFAQAKAFADCDVDAPNLHLTTNLHSNPTISDYYGSKKAFINQEKCVGCKACLKTCKFNAISYIKEKCLINEYACEGCSVCTLVCPTQAISMQKDIAGHLTLFKDTSVFSSAELKMGRGNSGMLVTEVKTALFNHAPITDLAIVDGSPGIGCPVIASISGMDLILIVTEPTSSGLSDLKRLVKTAYNLNVPIAVCINKYDVSLDNAEKIAIYCQNESIPLVGKIPFDKHAVYAINNKINLADLVCPAQKALYNTFLKVLQLIHQNS